MKKLFFITTFFLLFFSSCGLELEDGQNSSKFTDVNQNIQCKVELSDCEGQIIRTWIPSGYVKSTTYSDIFEFWDSKEQKEVRISGTVIVTKL